MIFISMQSPAPSHLPFVYKLFENLLELWKGDRKYEHITVSPIYIR